MNPRLHAVILPVVALLLVGGVIAIQVAAGGLNYEPLPPADPCAERDVTSQSDGIEGLTERLVLIGIDEAACSLGISREAFTLELAQSSDPTDAQIDALHEGLLSAVQRMQDDGTLPEMSELVDEALESADINDTLKTLIRALPDSVIDAALKTDDVLTRTIDELDLRAMLSSINDPDELSAQVEAAVTQAVKDSIADRLSNLL